MDVENNGFITPANSEGIDTAIFVIPNFDLILCDEVEMTSY